MLKRGMGFLTRVWLVQLGGPADRRNGLTGMHFSPRSQDWKNKLWSIYSKRERNGQMDRNRRFLQCHLRVTAARVFAREGARRATIIGKSFCPSTTSVMKTNQPSLAYEYDHVL